MRDNISLEDLIFKRYPIKILLYIYINGKTYTSRIIREAGVRIDSVAVYRIIHAMISGGFVRNCGEAGSIKYLELTDAGKDIVEFYNELCFRELIPKKAKGFYKTSIQSFDILPLKPNSSH